MYIYSTYLKIYSYIVVAERAPVTWKLSQAKLFNSPETGDIENRLQKFSIRECPVGIIQVSTNTSNI